MRTFALFQATILASLVFSQAVISQQCGKSALRRRIYNGEDAEPGAWPWLMHLGFYTLDGRSSAVSCGSALIDPYHVLTSAHCVTEEVNRRTGSWKLTQVKGWFIRDEFINMDPKAKVYDVDTVTVYPGYKRGELLSNDIALIKLKKPVNKMPICWQNANKDCSYLVGKTVAFAGFGTTGPHPIDDDTHAKNLKEFRNFRVQEYLSGEGIFHFKDPKEVTWTRGGDTGGPVMHKNPSDGRWYIVGALSGDRVGKSPVTDQSSDKTNMAACVPQFQEWIKKNW